MKTNYTHNTIEKKWIELWQKEKIYKTKELNNLKKKYILEEFPYPSGAGLHAGHVREYVGGDILARYYRMKGYQVLHAMGWDAFGLPAENAAIKYGKNPALLTYENIANFKRQMIMLGLSYDWDREYATCDSNYYAITQWLFIQFFKLGLVYKKNIPVYYCPFCKTGLAQEEVLSDGVHERCGNTVIQKKIPQWIFRITKYADKLLEGLDSLAWPKGAKEMQKNWIGKKEGIIISYKINTTPYIIDCFTTRPDTNFGATFIVLAPEHDFISKIIAKDIKLKDKNIYDAILTYVKKSLRKTDRERISEGKKKTGVFTGFYAVNNLNNKLLPIWISDFVLKDVGTGAVVGVPGHDKRDFEFAKAFNLEIIRVVVGKDKDKTSILESSQVQEDDGIMINSDFLNGLTIRQAKKKMMDFLEKNKWGRKTVQYHLRDWIFSRQRYWGEPIPMIYCARCAKNKISYWNSSLNNIDAIYHNNIQLYKNIKNWIHEVEEGLCGWFPLGELNLPLQLPKIDSYTPAEDGKSPLDKHSGFKNTTCPNCGKRGVRETDTMPNWAGSSWYFIHYTQSNNIGTQPQLTENITNTFNSKNIAHWLPVDCYIGGSEHTVLHLLYSRFWFKIMYDMGLVPISEPFNCRIKIGMVLAEDGRKMSKSYGNVINPDEIVSKFGADTIRIYEMFMAPFSDEVKWSTENLQGSYRFIKKIWKIFSEKRTITDVKSKEQATLTKEFQKLLVKVESDIESIKFNTAISAMMKFVNFWQKDTKNMLYYEHAMQFLKLLAPFAPFITEEIWRNIFNNKTSIHTSEWNFKKTTDIQELEISLPVQVNGKVRSVIVTHLNENKESIIKKAKNDPLVSKWIFDKQVKTIYIPNKIINFVF